LPGPAICVARNKSRIRVAWRRFVDMDVHHEAVRGGLCRGL
jgi:hypothetical protein